MTDTAFKPVISCVGKPSGRLAQVVATANRLASINRVFAAYLPTHIKPHVRIVSQSQEHWLIHADSAAWATRLRYLLPQLRTYLSGHLRTEVPTLKIRIRPPTADPTPNEPPRQSMVITDKAAQSLLGAAKTIADQDLSAALRKLASRRTR